MGRKFHYIGALILLMTSCNIFAQATRTWVSGVGDDANPCSRTAPGKTFAGAISKTATNGIISVLDPGGFGTVTITKSITIDGGGTEGSILATGTSGVTINAGPNGVVILRNLQIDGGGAGVTGINIISAAAVYVENCGIKGFISGVVSANTNTNGTQIMISDSVIKECSGVGITVSPATNSPCDLSLNRSSVESCAGGLLVNKGGMAILSDDTIAFNNGAGLKSTGLGHIQSFHNNKIFGNTPNGVPKSLHAPE